MPPKYSTRRQKYNNKNAKTNKVRKAKAKNNNKKSAMDQRKRIQRPDEVNFDEHGRVDFVTGFAKRKQKRRIEAAKHLLHNQHQQKVEFRKERREEEIRVLVKGGHMEDPVSLFLGESYRHDSDDGSDVNCDDDDGEDSGSESDSVSDVEDGADDEAAKCVNYENDDMVTTVITSIPGVVDRNTQFMNEIMGEPEPDSEEDEDEDDGGESCDNEDGEDINVQNDGQIQWLYDGDAKNGSNGSDKSDKMSEYERRKDQKKRMEIKQSKKRYSKKLGQMMVSIKEFNRKKKRKSNSKYNKKKRKSKSK
eukprot:CAMPEP_0202691636 /NCGR_PEP_ID=MMETSP1385-20130828/6297_1 /ASSEMBLY_ACC=CAM_ASM_000861 /TAXON_ID=933848 /ORGANISM="Elphidium margaritaceum" /LENGTH=305 /DNA_ID=CAMNT_0049347075 /DNA_START=30 /DNA_END=944 /DNA_ORIENTATION=-